MLWACDGHVEAYSCCLLFAEEIVNLLKILPLVKLCLLFLFDLISRDVLKRLLHCR